MGAFTAAFTGVSGSSATAGEIAEAVRAELAIELARLDVPVSSVSAGSSGDGAYAITVTVTDGTDPLENATVRLTEGASSVLAVTDADGNASFSLDAATYLVSVTKAGHAFTPTSRTVTGPGAGTLTAALEMTAVVAPAEPEDPALCLVWVDTSDILGEPRLGLEISIALTTPAPRSLSGRVVSGERRSMVADGSVPGRYRLEVERGLAYTARCQELFGAPGLAFPVGPAMVTLNLGALS